MRRDYDYDTYREMKREGSGMSSLLTGFLIGGAIGAIAAFLMAPQSGEETRAELREKTMELRDRAAATVDDTRARAEQAMAETRSRAGEAVQSLSTAAEDAARKAREKTEDLTHRVEETARKTRKQGEDLTNQADVDRANF